jgi:sporulation protein YlmC with PRC-barrel domain
MLVEARFTSMGPTPTPGHRFNVGGNAMASSSSLGRDDRSVATRSPRLPLRMSKPAVLLGTASVYGDSVYDIADRFLGEIQELVLDIRSGRVAYALMAVGGFLGMGRKLFAIPWSTVTVDRVYRRCVVNIDLEQLIDAPSLDGDVLPRMADPSWATQVHAYFGCKPYWE